MGCHSSIGVITRGLAAAFVSCADPRVHEDFVEKKPGFLSGFFQAFGVEY